MIPEDRDELHALAGEYVLGVLEPPAAREIEAALPAHGELRDAVAFWQERLSPLAALASPADPPAELWDRIAARLDEAAPRSARPRWWNRPAPWRWSTGVLAAAAAALALYIAAAPLAPVPRFVAVLHAPQQAPASWVATGGRNGLLIRALAGGAPPADRAFELWAIAPGSSHAQSLGVIPRDGVLRLGALPPAVRDGATLAISIEPPGGSPTGEATGPIVFVGTLQGM